MCIRLGNIDNHLKFKIAYGGYNDIDNEVEHQLEITTNTSGQYLPACPCRTYGLIVVLIYIRYMFACSVRQCLSTCIFSSRRVSHVLIVIQLKSHKSLVCAGCSTAQKCQKPSRSYKNKPSTSTTLSPQNNSSIGSLN